MQALDEQVKCEEGYQITSRTFFRFKDDNSDPHIRIVPFNSEHNQFVIALEPTTAKVQINTCKTNIMVNYLLSFMIID